MEEETKQQTNECTYQKQTWVDHFVDEAGFVVQQGTAMDALHFNHIEDGIEAAHNLVAQESVDREDAETALGERIDNIVEGETKIKSAEEADRVLHSLTVGGEVFDGSEDITVDADDGVKIDGATIKHTNNVTAGTASGGSGAKEFGGTIDIPSVTYDAQGHVTGKDKTTVTLPSNDATTSKHGLMSASDKTKLNGIETGAQKNTITGIKGAKESSYRTGNVNITLQNILGSTPIGDDFTGIYYNGSTFVTQNPSLQSTSWSKIAELSAAGKAKKAFSIGDEKTVTLTTGETITLVILGFDHDEKTGGGKAGITFGMKDLLNTSYPMNASSTNAGGWNESKMRTETMATLLSQLPSDLRNVIKAVNKKATAGNQGTSLTASSDKLWLFAAAELWSKTAIENSASSDLKNNAAAYNGEGTQYEYFKNTVGDAEPNNSCSALVKRKNGSTYYWWLRSPYVGNTAYFRLVNSNGYVYNNGAGNTYGVCFGFCV